jgi:hypothetical protein
MRPGKQPAQLGGFQGLAPEGLSPDNLPVERRLRATGIGLQGKIGVLG